jgi:hypothetical protein
MDFPDTKFLLSRLKPWTLVLLSVLVAPIANADSLRVLSQNMDRLFDNIDDGNNVQVLPGNRFRQRVKIAAKKFGSHFATEIWDRYEARYRLILIPGQDVSGINLAYLVRFGVEIKKVDQLFANKTFKITGNPLFTRPPLYLKACYIENCISMLNVHLRSMRGINSSQDGERVARKRLRQAETIAAWSNRFQQSMQGEPLLLLGDFNALTPGDKHVDVAGIIRGNPDNTAVRLPARDLVEPDLLDLTQLIPAAKRYSFIFRQKKQQLDYMFINQSFGAEVEAIVFSRIDYHFSDHAGLLAWFKW